MNFQRSLQEGYAKKVPKDIFKAKSLAKASEQAIGTASKIIVGNWSNKKSFVPSSFWLYNCGHKSELFRL